MIRQLAGAMALAVASIVGAIAPAHAQDQKGTLVFAVESLGAQTLDPILEGRPGNAVYQAIMYDSLVGFDLKKGGVGPGVAERWEMTPDGLTWTFFIRPGQTFHNGDKLTAHDVKFSLERQMGPGSLAAAAASMKRTIKSIEVVDDLTVKVQHDQPADRPAGQPVARRGARGRDHAQGLHREGGRGGVPQEADRQRPVEVRAQRAGRSHRVHRRRQALARHAELQGPARPAGAGGEHARRHGAHRRGGDRLDRAGDHAERLARRAGGAGGARHHAGDLPVLGHLQARDEGFADRQAARAPGAVAGHRSQAGDRARHERQGARALSVLDLRLHRLSSAPTAGRSGRPRPIATIRRWPRRCWPKRAIPTASSSSSPTPRCRARSSWSISAPRSPTCGPRSASR